MHFALLSVTFRAFSQWSRRGGQAATAARETIEPGGHNRCPWSPRVLMFKTTENRVVGCCSPPMVSVGATDYSPGNLANYSRLNVPYPFGTGPAPPAVNKNRILVAWRSYYIFVDYISLWYTPEAHASDPPSASHRICPEVRFESLDPPSVSRRARPSLVSEIWFDSLLYRVTGKSWNQLMQFTRALKLKGENHHQFQPPLSISLGHYMGSKTVTYHSSLLRPGAGETKPVQRSEFWGRYVFGRPQRTSQATPGRSLGGCRLAFGCLGTDGSGQLGPILDLAREHIVQDIAFGLGPIAMCNKGGTPSHERGRWAYRR